VKFPNILEKSNLWTIDDIDSLLNIPESESEKLDFKLEVTDLTRHICAMANTSGGFIVLGIEESETGSFKKIGFSNGDQDEIDLKIGGMQFFRID
jgi:predicted HTH transcriptional regulator